MNKILIILMLFVVSCTDTIDDIIVDADNPETIINSYRTTGFGSYNPVAKVYRTDTLDMIATLNSEYMNDNDTMCHRWKDGTNVLIRAKMLGYTHKSLGENVAYNYPSYIDVFDGWVHSPCHLANIMNPKFTKFGISKVGNYYTLVLSN